MVREMPPTGGGNHSLTEWLESEGYHQCKNDKCLFVGNGEPESQSPATTVSPDPGAGVGGTDGQVHRRQDATMFEGNGIALAVHVDDILLHFLKS